jgi:hypothetical protein
MCVDPDDDKNKGRQKSQKICLNILALAQYREHESSWFG